MDNTAETLNRICNSTSMILLELFLQMNDESKEL